MKAGHFLLSICLSTVFVLSGGHAKAQINADFSATVSSDPVTYPGYPSTGTLSIIINTPNDPEIIPAASFAVIATAGGAVEFVLNSFSPPPGWALDTENSDPTNVVIYNTGELSASLSHIPVSIDVPTRAIADGETTHMIDIVPIRDGWRDPDDGNHQPDVKVTVLDVSLPVVLSSFQATKESTTALLSWATTEESNSSHFAVEHSIDAKSWREIGRVKSAGTSNSLQRYSYTHNTPSGGTNYYRLRMTDIDGSFELSTIKSLEFSRQTNTEVFPNPARDILSIRSDNWQQVTGIELYNGIGIAAYRSGDRPEREIKTGHLAPGMYILKITRADDKNEALRIVIGK